MPSSAASPRKRHDHQHRQRQRKHLATKRQRSRLHRQRHDRPSRARFRQSVSLMVAFSPTAAGSSTGSLLMVSNATNSPTTTISLGGTGVQRKSPWCQPAWLSGVSPWVSPYSDRYHEKFRNRQSDHHASKRSADRVLQRADSPCPLPWPPAAPRHSPSASRQLRAGNVTGTLTLVSNASNSPLSVMLTGTGVAQVRTLSTNPTSLNFGSPGPEYQCNADCDAHKHRKLRRDYFSTQYDRHRLHQQRHLSPHHPRCRTIHQLQRHF